MSNLTDLLNEYTKLILQQQEINDALAMRIDHLESIVALLIAHINDPKLVKKVQEYYSNIVKEQQDLDKKVIFIQFNKEND